MQQIVESEKKTHIQHNHGNMNEDGEVRDGTKKSTLSRLRTTTSHIVWLYVSIFGAINRISQFDSPRIGTKILHPSTAISQPKNPYINSYPSQCQKVYLTI